MNTYSQSKEDSLILNYFGNYKGTLLSIGENDGTTFSNARLLIENGWKANLIEPGKVFEELDSLYEDNDDVDTFYFAIGDKNKIVSLFDSGAHVPDGADKGLVSTIKKQEINRWPDVQFIERKVQMMTWAHFINYYATSETFDFISIDAEGFDEIILKQIDLEAVGCKCLIVEWNSNNELGEKFANYCKEYKIAHINAENIIFVK